MLIIAAHPFFASFFQADWLGKSIYLSLLALSVVSWALIIHKYMITNKLHKQATSFHRCFKKHKQSPLNFSLPSKGPNPFHDIYLVLKKQTYELLNKNHQFVKESGKPASLSPTDIDFIDTHVAASIASQVQKLEKNIYILSTIVTLAPFLGLLGTVWGILVFFSQMNAHQGGGSSQVMLGGLSLALTTTVLGLIVAIPALIGYNYLKNSIKNIHMEMESFSSEVMASVELQYRQVEIQ